MIIWITFHLFEYLFNTQVTNNNEALGVIQFFGFIELLAEIVGIFILTGVAIYELVKRQS